MTGYYAHFVQHYATVAAPLSNLMSGTHPWEWGACESRAFQALQDALVAAPILQFPDFMRPFHIKMDAL